jgi:hypothetical protein
MTYTTSGYADSPSNAIVVTKPGLFLIEETPAVRDAINKNILIEYKEAHFGKGCRGSAGVAEIVLEDANNVAVGNNADSHNIGAEEEGYVNGITAVVTDRPKGDSLKFDIINTRTNASIFSKAPRIAPGDKTIGGYDLGSKDKVECQQGDNLRLDILQVGSSSPGQNLTVKVQIGEFDRTK